MWLSIHVCVMRYCMMHIIAKNKACIVLQQFNHSHWKHVVQALSNQSAFGHYYRLCDEVHKMKKLVSCYTHLIL